MLISLADYNSLLETMHLLGNPRNAARLVEALDDTRQGRNVRERTLVDE